MIVREIEPGDVEAARRIYAHHVLHGLGTFEEVPPDAADFAGRVAAVTETGLPWRVAEIDKRIVGYAYAGPFRTRTAYRYTVEDSVYVAEGFAGQGVGRRLLAEVIEGCRAMGLRTLIAMIGDSGNAASIGLHRSLGYEIAGVVRAAGWKHGRWADLVIMELALGGGDSLPPEGRGWARD
jgi:phosphinothricin acetyltransferase